MLRTILFIALAALLIASAPVTAIAADNSGTFRGKWWNYYDRASERSARGEFEAALVDLDKALASRDRDQIMARTYGMHFIDYFPHRERGIIHYFRGDFDQALAELETSYRQQESAKAAYYLNLVRKETFRRSGARFPAPEIIIDSPQPGETLAGLTVTVRGRIRAQGLVARSSVNGRIVRIDLAQPEQPFSLELQLEEGADAITVAAADLLGTVTDRTVAIAVDRDGPAFSLDTVKRQGESVRLVGKLEDRTGIASIAIAGQPVVSAGSQSRVFDVVIPYRPGSRVELRATDILGNETIADFALDSELAARNRRAPLLLAAAAPFGLFDRQPPRLQLKEGTDTPRVFVDRYYVEGEAGDDGGVERIVVNGHEVALAKGKKVFFSKVVKLTEGNNRISVEAYDRAGNRNQSAFTVNRTVPAAFQIASRMAVTLLPFDGPAAGESARLGDDLLTGAFIDQKRFQVVDREKLLHILREQKLSREKLADADHSIKVGRLIAADAVIASAVREDKRSLEVVARIINTETGEVMEVKDIYTEDKSLSSLREQMEGLAAKIAGSFPVAGGMVISRDRTELLTDLGGAAKIRKSTGAVLYRKGKEVRHPVSGRSLGSDTVKLGEGRFEEVQREFSRLRLTGTVSQQEPAAKDLLITR